MPLTGRTHQLRAHAALIGCPILGDGKYGGKAAHPTGAPKGLMLHARELELPGPAEAACASPPSRRRDSGRPALAGPLRARAAGRQPRRAGLMAVVPTRLIVFDCDGTLVDSQATIVTCAQAAFVAEGLLDLGGRGRPPDRRPLPGRGRAPADARLTLGRPQAGRHYKAAFRTTGRDQVPHEPLFPGHARASRQLLARASSRVGHRQGDAWPTLGARTAWVDFHCDPADGRSPPDKPSSAICGRRWPRQVRSCRRPSSSATPPTTS